jgi:hypothetical protein
MTDEQMREVMAKTKPYAVVILRNGPQRYLTNAPEIIWEHGRRNLELRAAERISIVCPVTDESDVCGLCIFNADLDDTKRIMDGDPGVQAGVFIYEIHPCRGIPGDALPG